MWRHDALITAIGLTLTTLSSSSGDEINSSDLLISDRNWVRFDVAMGRLMATTIRTKQDRQRAERDLPCGATESLTVSIDRGLISLQYVAASESWQLAVRVVRRDDVEIRWTRRATDGRLFATVYVQRPGEDVSLAVSEGEMPACTYRASSLWHLAIVHPEVCREHLVGVMRRVRPEWPVADEANEIRETLLHVSPWEPATSLAEVRLLVAQLSHPDFRARQRADRELVSRGQRLLGLLNELDPQNLDAEQRLRIQQIRRVITSNTSDTPRRVATWLANDKRIWLALMDDDDPQCRLAAGRQLTRICEQNVDFDPHAEPLARAEQVAAIRTQLLRR